MGTCEEERERESIRGREEGYDMSRAAVACYRSTILVRSLARYSLAALSAVGTLHTASSHTHHSDALAFVQEARFGSSD